MTSDITGGNDVGSWSPTPTPTPVPKAEGYACDAGCGASLVLHPGDTLMRNGWYHTFTPHGQPTVYACSAHCNRVIAERLETDEPANQRGE